MICDGIHFPQIEITISLTLTTLIAVRCNGWRNWRHGISI